MNAAVQAPSSYDQVVRLNVSWNAYTALLQELGEDCHARLTYDGETLEIMSPGAKHELIANAIADIIALAAVEWSINLANFGSTTFKTEPRGFEADKAYYLDAHRRIKDVEHIDLTIDPAPDLVVEVDIASSSSRRLATYAALRVPEVWSYKNDNFALLALVEGKYVNVDTSRVLRGLPATQVAKRIEISRQAKGDALAFRADWQKWLRENRHLHFTE